ncbi:MAG TPA: tetratricopeptide repeat protein [Patescibacteria group bacterium]|nr:tetratricopeptide repeat protein [Patescibacteria group bacterium]
MKRFVVLFCLILLGVATVVRGQGLDDEYVQIFRLIQEADSLSSNAPSQALAKYLDAQTALDRLHKGSPDWNTRIVTYRLSYLAERIAALSPTVAPGTTTSTNDTTAAAKEIPARPGPVVASADSQGQLTSLQQRIVQLQSDNGLLQAKLKEALAMRPAASDPMELAKAQDRIKVLQKENELLKAAREKEANTVDIVGQQDAQRSLAEANRKASEQGALVAKLSLEKEALETRLKHLSESAVDTRPAAAPGGGAAALKQLQRERDELQKKLEKADKELANRKRKGGKGRSQELETELTSLRARVDALEAKPDPYSEEELKLLNSPEGKLAVAIPRSGKRSIRELPPGSAAEVAEAQRYFAAKDYDKAEAAYQQVLQKDPKNAAALANLAVIQVEAHHFEPAESNIQQALALDADDPYSLYVLGILRFREGKFDDALGALSRSAKLDPQNAEVQNYLGLALSEKGMRTPAEAALRKAIQLQPGYAGAHYNLAVVYATQQPPATELARFHYQKAISAGHPRNAELEKRFEPRQ